MTTFGGGILAWSAEGDINAGRGSKTTVVYTPPRAHDALGNVVMAPQTPAAGAGIATLNPIPEVPRGDVDLIAPLGTIDPGEAGVRSSGNVNVAALHVVNAANIQAQGNSSGAGDGGGQHLGAQFGQRGVGRGGGLGRERGEPLAQCGAPVAAVDHLGADSGLRQ